MMDDEASLPAPKAGSKRPAKRKEPSGKATSSSKGLVQMSLAAAFLSAGPKACKKEESAKPQRPDEKESTPCTVKDPTDELAPDDGGLCKLQVSYPDARALEAGSGTQRSGDPPGDSGRAGIEKMDLPGLWRFACGTSTTTAAKPRGVLAVKEDKQNGESSRGSGGSLSPYHPPSSEAQLIKNQDMVKIKDGPDCTVADVKNESCSLGSYAHDLSEDEEQDAEEGNSFEQEREERIRRNQQRLLELGISSVAPGLSMRAGSRSQNASSKPRPARRKPLAEQVNVPLRRSTRGQGVAAHLGDLTEPSSNAYGTKAPSTRNESVPIEYDDSTVYRYICQSADSENRRCQSSVAPEGATLKGFTALDKVLVDESLTRAYGIDVLGDILVAGGHGGRASIWGLRDLETDVSLEEEGMTTDAEDSTLELQPLMRAKLHTGWICDVQLLRASEQFSQGSGPAPLLMTAANDATVALWDISKAGSLDCRPCKVLETSNLHNGSGIFSMRHRGSSVLTASKDWTVAISILRSQGCSLELDRRLEFHEGVVKCARWRDDNTIASSGNDRSICIQDLRTGCSGGNGGEPSVRIAEAHAGSVNCVEWNPFDENLLLSTGLDNAIQVHDIRRADKVCYTFLGHSAKGKCIYNPQWTDSGKAIVSGGDRKLLSVYCCRTGTARSRGDLGFDPKTMLIASTSCVGNGSDDRLFLSSTKYIAPFCPSWIQR